MYVMIYNYVCVEYYDYACISIIVLHLLFPFTCLLINHTFTKTCICRDTTECLL